MAIFAVGSLIAGAAGTEERPDRRPRRPGHRRVGAAVAVARAHLRGLPAGAAAAGARDLGRGVGGRARGRPARRRGADRGGELALDLLHQPAGRRRRGRDPAHPRRGVARSVGVARRPRRASGCSPPGCAAVVWRSSVRRVGLALGAHPRAARPSSLAAPGRLLDPRAPPRGAAGGLLAVSQRPLPGRQRRGVRARRRLLGR